MEVDRSLVSDARTGEATAGRYALGELLGAGGAARVYASTDARGREVAVKILERPAAEDPVAAARLTREAAVLSSLDHPGLVRVIEIGRDERDRPFLVMERVHGETLRERLAREGPLAPNEAWRVVREVALALRTAHAAGVLHRDLTPSNVLLDRRGRAKLGDFGLARRAEDPRLSREGASTGTPAYMAPEQWWGAELDERTDVYGLGAILYECLAGQPPWHGEPADILHRVATGAPPPLAERASVPAPVLAFVHRCLAREPRERPADVLALVAEGDRAFERPRRALRPDVIALAAALLAAPIALGFGGSRDPLAWIHEAGAGGWLVVVTATLAALLGSRLRAWRSLLEAAPLFAGASVFFTGTRVAMSHVTGAPAEERFTLFHLGLAESSSGWFLGAALSAALFATTAAGGERDGWRPPSARAIAAAVACAVAAALAWEPGAAAMAALTVALLALGVPARRPDAAVGSVQAVLALALVAWVRLESEEARLFDSPLDRASRALELARIDGAQSAGWMVALIGVLALAAAADWRGLRAWPRARVIATAVTASAVLAVLVLPWIAAERDRRALWDELAPHFSVWTELEPPPGAGDGPARIGPTLQLGRRRVAIDGADVAPLAVLEGASPTGPLLVADRLGPLVHLEVEGPELVLAADRTLPWRVVDRALGAAYDLGVRRADVVLLPGAMPALDPGAPPEARVVLPRDLRALELRLVAEGEGPRPAPDEPFGRVVARLSSARDRRLAVGPSHAGAEITEGE